MLAPMTGDPGATTVGRGGGTGWAWVLLGRMAGEEVAEVVAEGDALDPERRDVIAEVVPAGTSANCLIAMPDTSEDKESPDLTDRRSSRASLLILDSPALEDSSLNGGDAGDVRSRVLGRLASGSAMRAVETLAGSTAFTGTGGAIDVIIMAEVERTTGGLVSP